MEKAPCCKKLIHRTCLRRRWNDQIDRNAPVFCPWYRERACAPDVLDMERIFINFDGNTWPWRTHYDDQLDEFNEETGQYWDDPKFCQRIEDILREGKRFFRDPEDRFFISKTVEECEVTVFLAEPKEKLF